MAENLEELAALLFSSWYEMNGAIEKYDEAKAKFKEAAHSAKVEVVTIKVGCWEVTFEADADGEWTIGVT